MHFANNRSVKRASKHARGDDLPPFCCVTPSTFSFPRFSTLHLLYGFTLALNKAEKRFSIVGIVIFFWHQSGDQGREKMPRWNFPARFWLAISRQQRRRTASRLPILDMRHWVQPERRKIFSAIRGASVRRCSVKNSVSFIGVNIARHNIFSGVIWKRDGFILNSSWNYRDAHNCCYTNLRKYDTLYIYSYDAN